MSDPQPQITPDNLPLPDWESVPDPTQDRPLEEVLPDESEIDG